MCEQCESAAAQLAADKAVSVKGDAATGKLLALGVLISGSGSNLQAIIDAIESGMLHAHITVVISNVADAYGLQRAKDAGIPAVHIDPLAGLPAGSLTAELSVDQKKAAAHAYNCAIRDALVEHGVEYVAMAGYMKLLGVEVLEAFPMKVLNLHPALLPSFPGAHGIADALAYGAKVTGVTVHFADEVFDRGPIIAQKAVRIIEGDTEEALAARIHEAEHEIYPRAIELIAQNRLSFDGRRVHIAPQ